MLLFCFFIGVVLGIVVIFSSDNYIKLLTSDNRILYAYINGSAETAVLFWKKLIMFLTPVVLIFLLCLNYYLGLLSYIFITYQSTLLILSCGAIIKTYGFSGFFNVLFITMPTNIFYFCVLMFFVATCLSRSKHASKVKTFKTGFDELFWLKTAATVLAVFLLGLLVCLVYPLFLKNSVFIIF